MTSTITPFIVLIEQRRLKDLGLRILGTLLLLAALACAHTAHGQTLPNKISADLQAAMRSTSAPQVNWAKDFNSTRYFKVVLVSNSTDPDLTALRSAVLASGGSVYMRYVSAPALAVMLPLGQIGVIAARPDVTSIAPNRLTARTSSALEFATGAMNLRSYSAGSYTGLDGTGVGIAVLDSGVEKYHKSLLAADGKTLRVKAAVNMQNANNPTIMGFKDWAPGIDVSASLYPGSATMVKFEKGVDNLGTNRPDLYGHGSFVASIAAGRGSYQANDSSGIAPNANLVDVQVLNGSGVGQLSDVLAGIDWVIYHAKQYNIRIINLSLATDSTQSWQTDPLCIAVRAASAAGITVVVAGGNFGQTPTGAERFGTISSPGNDPTVITVGSVNTKGTAARSDDTVNHFSSRGPTRGAAIDANGVRRADNLLKPDLVAPGNKIVGELGTDASGAGGSWNYLARSYSVLSSPFGGANQPKLQTLMTLSGTSVAAPAVSGTVALMLQANPGLTPPLVKAILQYSAQPIAGANLLQQGAGLLNVDGAVKLARSLRSDIRTAVESGTMAAGASLLAANAALPLPSSSINGQTFNWSRIVYAGGNQILTGNALFTQFQPIWDPRIVWARGAARRATVETRLLLTLLLSKS